jgi:hypothetical protein
MDYSDEQRTLIRRIGEMSARIAQARAQHRSAQAAQVEALSDMANGLNAAIAGLTRALEHSDELTVLVQQHGDLWREFLDTL